MTNRPVNPDARATGVLCRGQRTRAGYWERYVSMVAPATGTKSK